LDCCLGGGFDRDSGEQKKKPRTGIDWTFVKLCSDLRFKLPLALEIRRFSLKSFVIYLFVVYILHMAS
jgi:hypothetical protein